MERANTAIWKSSSVMTGSAVALAYIVAVWAMWHSWAWEVKSSAAEIDPSNTDAILVTIEQIDQPLLLRLLTFPVVNAGIVENGGALPFWPVVLQGLWLGLVAWAGFTPTWSKFIALTLAPVAMVYNISGHLFVSLVLAVPYGLSIVGLLWTATDVIRKQTLNAAS